MGVDGGGAGGSGGGGSAGGSGAQPGANTPCALHASGHITANVSFKDRLAGSMNSTRPACAIRANWRTGKAQSSAEFSVSESSEPRNSLRRAEPSGSPVAQPLPLNSARPLSITMSVHGSCCGVGGVGGCGGCCGGCGGCGGETGGRGGCGGDGGKAGDGGGAQPGANTPCTLHASGHIAANGSVRKRPAGGTNAMLLICWPSASLKGSLQTPAAANSSGPNIRARRAVA
eukprot:scaffold24708_cov67-Phaeocystis_antarctica.AAC.9